MSSEKRNQFECNQANSLAATISQIFFFMLCAKKRPKLGAQQELQFLTLPVERQRVKIIFQYIQP